MESPLHKSKTLNEVNHFSFIGREIINSSFNHKHSNLTIENRSCTPDLLLSPKFNFSTPYRKKQPTKLIQVNNIYNNNITIIHQNAPKKNPSTILKVASLDKKKLKKSILKLKQQNMNTEEEILSPPSPSKNVKFNANHLIAEYEYNSSNSENTFNVHSFRSFKSEQPSLHNQPGSLVSVPFSQVDTLKIDEIKEKIALMDKCHYEKRLGIFYGFSAFTFKNEQKKNNDKLSIFINKKVLSNSHNKNEKISVNYFGMHLGVNGDTISSFLKDNLHKQIFMNDTLYQNAIETIFTSFEYIENESLKKKPFVSTCGSSSLVLMSLNDKIMIANVGNSKCILSTNHSFQIYSFTHQHSPNNSREMERLDKYNVVFKKDMKSKGKKYMILPTNIHSSRIIGCSNSKTNSSFLKGGVIACPEIFEITSDENSKLDFLILANDQISYSFTNKEIILFSYISIKESLENKLSYGKMLDNIVSTIAKESVGKGIKGNISLIIIDNGWLAKLHKENNIKKVSEIITQLSLSVMDFEDIYPLARIYDEEWYSSLIKSRNGKNDRNSLVMCLEKNNNDTLGDNRMTTQTMSYNNSVERYRPSSCQNEESKDVIVNTIVDNKVKDKKKKRCFSLCGCFL